jgi:hypothetical protein
MKEYELMLHKYTRHYIKIECERNLVKLKFKINIGDSK